MLRRRCKRALAALIGLAVWQVGALPMASASELWKVIVPFPAGGSSDMAGRMLAEQLRLATDANVIVENQPGANGNVGAAAVARATPDGKTLLLTSDGYATVNPILFKDSMKFEASDLTPVGIVGFQPALLVVPDASPMKNFADLLARGRKDEVTYSSGGVGSAGHLTMGYLANVAGLKLTHVPHSGGAPAMTSLLGSFVDSAFVAIPNALPHVRSGKLRALAVSSPQRLPQLPDVPTVAESGYPGFETQIAAIVLVPAKTPPDRRQMLSDLIQDAVSKPVFVSFLEKGGFVPARLTGEESAAWVARETARWRELIVDKQIVGR